MKSYKTLHTIKYKFCDIQESYPLAAKIERITEPDILYNNFKFLFENEVKEKFAVFWLNTQNKVIGYEIVSEGTLDSSVVHQREVFRGAIIASCKSIIIAHNHPSGGLEPSNEDINKTKKLIEASKIIDIPILDHIIFSDNGFTSFIKRGII